MTSFRTRLLLLATLLLASGCGWWWLGNRREAREPVLGTEASGTPVRRVHAPEPPPGARRNGAAGSTRAGVAREMADVETEELRMQQLGQGVIRAFRGMMLFAAAHEDSFPDSLDQISPDDLGNEPLVFHHPSTGEPLALEYTTGLKSTDSPETLVLATPPLANGKRVCCFLDGSVRTMSEEEYRTSVEQLSPIEPVPQ